jgi:copper chaperone
MMVELHVGGMTCAHCVRAVSQAIERADPEARVSVDLESGRLRAETRLAAEVVAQIVVAEGYEVRPG